METIAHIVGLITGSLTSASDLTRADQLAAAGALAWDLGILVLIRALASGEPAVRECDRSGEYDKAA